jgi:hypothetical protein
MRTALPLLAIVLFFACQQKQAASNVASTFNLDSVKAHIVNMSQSYSQRFLTNDSLFYVERYCADAEVLAPNAPAIKGRDSIRKYFLAKVAIQMLKLNCQPVKFMAMKTLSWKRVIIIFRMVRAEV